MCVRAQDEAKHGSLWAVGCGPWAMVLTDPMLEGTVTVTLKGSWAYTASQGAWAYGGGNGEGRGFYTGVWNIQFVFYYCCCWS